MQEDVAKDAQGAAARRLVVLDAQDGFPDVGLLGRLDGLLDLFDGARLYGLGAGDDAGSLPLPFRRSAVSGSVAAARAPPSTPVLPFVSVGFSHGETSHPDESRPGR